MVNKKDNIISLYEMEKILGVSFDNTPSPKVIKEAKRKEKAQAKREAKVQAEREAKAKRDENLKKREQKQNAKEHNYVTINTFISVTVLFSLLSGVAGAALFNLALNKFFESPSQTAAVTPGASAYEIAVKNGFKGSEKEWLLSLKGEKGNPGLIGTQGLQGLQGEKGDKGEQGVESKIQGLTSIPGWPANCLNPKFTQVQIFDEEDVGEFYNMLTCD